MISKYLWRCGPVSVISLIKCSSWVDCKLSETWRTRDALGILTRARFLSVGVEPVVSVAHDVVATRIMNVALTPGKCDCNVDQTFLLVSTTLKQATKCLHHEVCVQRDSFRSLAVRGREDLHSVSACYPK